MINTPAAEQIKIVLFGLRNSGKSSLINNLFEREVAIVSPHAGTTTDPVTKSIELGNLGPVLVTDTAGLDDTGELGNLRVKQSLEHLKIADISILVTRADLLPSESENFSINYLFERNKKIIPAVTFADKNFLEDKKEWLEKNNLKPYVMINNLNREGIEELKRLLIQFSESIKPEMTPVEGLVNENDLVLLVVPIDLAAPKGRLILPQVETIRDLLDRDCAALIVKERELEYFYSNLKIKPKLVITDSQAFNKVASYIPEDQPLTSFSILFARKKWDFTYFIKSFSKLKKLPEKCRVLILEACSHHRQADDIGTVKIPRLFRQLIKPQAEFDFLHALPPQKELKKFDLLISCGGCMISQNRGISYIEELKQLNIPAINYGLFLAYVNGLLPRALKPFPLEYEIYKREIL